MAGALCAALLALALAGCGRDDARDTRADIASGETEATTQVAEARGEAAYEVAVAQAEGAHAVAVERCEAHSGDRRQTCIDRADAELQNAKHRAGQARDGRH